jgi:hypothetical protein
MQMRQKKQKNLAPALIRYCLAHRRLFGGAGIALFAVLLASNFLFRYTQDHSRILRYSGKVYIERAGEKISPIAGTLLNAQDKIVTGENAFVEVAYDDTYRDVLRIGSESSVVLESAVIEKQTNIFMDKGEIILKLQDLGKGSTFKVRTPVAIAGVRGTSFSVQLNGNQAVITDYESKIFVKGLTEDYLEMKEELLLSAGWKTQVTRFEKPSQVERISPQEYAAWQAWLDEVAVLSKGAPVRSRFYINLALLQNTRFLQHTPFLRSAINANAVSSAPFLAFLLYMALAANLGRVFLREI